MHLRLGFQAGDWVSAHLLGSLSRSPSVGPCTWAWACKPVYAGVDAQRVVSKPVCTPEIAQFNCNVHKRARNAGERFSLVFPRSAPRRPDYGSIPTGRAAP